MNLAEHEGTPFVYLCVYSRVGVCGRPSVVCWLACSPSVVCLLDQVVFLSATTHSVMAASPAARLLMGQVWCPVSVTQVPSILSLF